MSAERAAVIERDLAEIAACGLPWERLSGTRIVVTGASGFLGGYLVRALLALARHGQVSRPLEVVALVRDVDKAAARLADVAADPQLSFQRWDLNALGVPDLGAAHYVLHAASQASPRFYATDPVGTLLPNTVGTAALLEALRRSPDPRGLLFVSSGDVYGGIDSLQGLKEDDYGVTDPIQARSCYAESKKAGEALCAAWSRQHGMPTWIGRLFHTYGPGLTADDGRVFSDFAWNVARGEDIVMNSDGTARRAFCYVNDVVTGLFTVMLAGAPGVPYNVANAQAELSVMELAELLQGQFPEKNIRVERRVAAGQPDRIPGAFDRRVPDTQRLESLGWRASVAPAEGFRRMVLSLS